MTDTPILSVCDLVVEIPTRHCILRPVDGVSFDIAAGPILGVVGESGASRSMTGNAAIGLLDRPAHIAAGEVRLSDQPIQALGRDALRRLRGRKMGMIFQDSLTSLNPLPTIGEQLTETILEHMNVSQTEARKRAIAALDEVRIPAAAARIGSYPHEFSGGMRQRVVIALALCAEPDLVIADEPTTALDVSVQAQIMALLKRLCRDRDRRRQGRRGARRDQDGFPETYASLNPRWRVRDIIAEPVTARAGSKTGLAERLPDQAGLSAADADKYPHEFSGGQRQRICIARALASGPSTIVCDEPTSALDVSVQAQVPNLMSDLREELGLTYLFISHDLTVVRHVADRIGVLYLGRLVEEAASDRLFETPKHPYTQTLLEAAPRMDAFGREVDPPKDEVPDPISPPPGCAFHPRCPTAVDRCRRDRREMRPVGDTRVACYLSE